MSDTAIAPTPINWEAVRALAMVVGVREAARRMEISQEAAMKRCQREGWLSTPEAKRANKLAIAERSGITAPACPQLSAGALIQAELAQLGSKTRISIARGIAKAGEHIETLPGAQIVEDANNIKSIAQTADLVHGWKENTAQVKIRLDVLSGAQEAQAVEIEATSEPIVSSWEQTESVDPLDGY
jgi:hypothetical protein